MVISLEEYDIVIGDVYVYLTEWLAAENFSKILVLVDENTAEHCWPLLRTHLPADAAVFQIQSGESFKNIATCQLIWQQMLDKELDRKALLINLGGGVIGDMGGFCAGTYKRGIQFLQMPTTLLSQVDASVGGKLGIDHAGFKNVVGLFQNPQAVLIDPDFLNTLPARELRSGFAEIIKHALIADAKQWQELSALATIEQMDWTSWISRSVAIKREIVAIDPFEQNQRKLLNFGHTIGHAVESYCLTTDQPLTHGEAVAWGMMSEVLLSEKVGLPAETAQHIIAWLQGIYGLPALSTQVLAQLIPLMRNDKKNIGGQINFSMLEAPGRALINQTATEEEILRALEKVNSFLQDN